MNGLAACMAAVGLAQAAPAPRPADKPNPAPPTSVDELVVQAPLAKPAPKLNLDPTGRFVKDIEPFLSRRPTEGCRVRVTGDADPMGESGNARAGATCVRRF